MNPLPLLALLACAPEAPAAEPIAVGHDLSGTTIEVREGADLVLPDPAGRTVVLELIRSADW